MEYPKAKLVKKPEKDDIVQIEENRLVDVAKEFTRIERREGGEFAYHGFLLGDKDNMKYDWIIVEDGFGFVTLLPLKKEDC